MMSFFFPAAFQAASATETKAIQEEAQQLALGLPDAEGMPSRSELVLAKSLVKGTRGYIERVTNQINGTYENGLYDACAVMIRRLIETLIIEAFEFHKIGHKIQDANGDYHHLSRLIPATISETTWTLGRNAKKSLPELKDLGDLSAHSRRHNAHRGDIDKIMRDLRIVTQELIYLANLK